MDTFGILLAAGYSRRFGAADKLLHRLPNGESVAVQSARHLRAAVPDVCVVVRAQNHALIAQYAAIECFCLESAENEHMADSLKRAIHHAANMATPPQSFIIALADMPYIRVETIQKIVQVFKKEKAIVVPTYQGKRGHPVLFPARFAADLLQLTGDQGAKSIIAAHPEDVIFMPCDDAGIVHDIDTVADVK